ncbi:MAG: SPFH domain-containing protein [Planctomycetota bacterium]
MPPAPDSGRNPASSSASDVTDDQQTYGRAGSAALLGLGTQLVFAVIVAGLGLYSQSSAFYAATWYLFGGLPIWITLWMLYNQHRLERVEALEAEQLAQEDARAAALFDEAGHNLATARKRLDSFYKWGLNAVSITVAIYLLAAGLALFFGNYNQIDSVDGESDYQRFLASALSNPLTNPWMLVGFTTLIGFLGFLVARYIAGMTRVEQWQLLRGGAAYLIGNVLVVILLGAATLAFVLMQNAGVLAALSLVIPALMALLGLETLLAFVFGIYRPRKANEVVRPAFDSRLLGWLTSPESLGRIVSETINYQFGFEITKSWFYVLLGRALTPLILFGGLLLIGMTSVVIVAPNQQAVITNQGAFARIAEPGVSFKMPWPVGRARKVDVARSQQVVIGGYDVSKRIPGKATLWTNEHVLSGDDKYFVTAPTQIDDPAIRIRVEQELQGFDSLQEGDPSAEATGSSSGSLISMQAIVTYNIGDLAAYVAADSVSRPEQVLAAIAQRHLNAIVATRQVDALLGEGKTEAGKELLALVRRDVAQYGLNVQDVSLYDVHPPKDDEVADAFLKQVNALQSQKTAVENAERDAIGTLSNAAGSRAEALRIEKAIAQLTALREQRDAAGAPADIEAQIVEQEAQINRLIDRAGGEAARVLANARQQRWEVALAEKAESGRFAFELSAFNLAPEYFKTRYYLDAIAEAFGESNRRVISTVPITDDSTIRLNLEDAGTASDLFTPD